MRHLITATLVVSILLLAACGGDGEPTGTQNPSPSGTRATPRPKAIPEPSPSPQVETLAFIREGDIWLINADGTDERRLTSLGNVQSFSWVSRSELDVATGEDRSGHFLVDVQGNARELAFLSVGPAVDVGPYDFSAEGSWSLDGARYVLPANEELVVFDRAGTEVARIQVKIPLKEQPEKGDCGFNVSHRLVLGPPVFSPDGQEILVAVFCEVVLGATNQPATLYRVSLAGGVADPLGLSTNLRAIGPPRRSPDGLRLAQTGADRFGVCHSEITLFVGDAEGANSQQLTLPQIEELHRRSPVPQFRAEVGYDWSPESDAVVATFNVFICDPAIEQVVGGLYILKLDGTAEEKLVDGPTSSPAWSPSDQLIAYVVPGDTPTIRLFDLTTRQVTDLTQGVGPAWQPAPPP